MAAVKRTQSDKTRRETSSKAGDATTSDAIINAALEIAEEVGWGGLRLRDVAARVGISLVELEKHFRDADAIANAWFHRAQQAMIDDVPDDFLERSARDRLEFLIQRWFDALAPHRKVTAEMLSAKLWWSHPHHYVPMVFDLSRLIQWLREAAGLDAVGRQRQVEEIALTLLFLGVLRTWCGDDTPGQERTRAKLAWRLDQTGRFLIPTYGSGDRGEMGAARAP